MREGKVKIKGTGLVKSRERVHVMQKGVKVGQLR